MTAAEVRDACGELATWLPEAEARIAVPDTDTTRTRGQPTSRPPWNGQVAMVLFDALEGIRRLRADLLYEVTGRRPPLAPMGATGATLTAIVNLCEAVDGPRQREVVVWAARLTTPILQLAPIDEAERPLRVAADCPYCAFSMLRVFPRSGRVACLRAAGGCTDANGLPPVGLMGRSGLDGTPSIFWGDGLVT